MLKTYGRVKVVNVQYIILILTLIIAFFCGSIPSGYLLVKHIKGIDITKFGSGNIGSTNVKRAAGSKISLLTQIVDILKGATAVWIAMLIVRYFKIDASIGINSYIIFSAAGLCSVLGHSYTPFLGFNGGKGVNTTAGVFLVLATIPTIISMIIFIILRLTTSIVSIRSLVFGLSIALLSFIMGVNTIVVVAALLAEVLIVYRHKANIIRLINGEEK